MNQAQRICATCSSFDPAHGCWGSVNALAPSGAAQAPHRSSGPDDCCADHRTRLESDALDAAIYALWQPLLIKSSWSRTRHKERRQERRSER